jgi:hypothetical protein
LWRDVIGFRPIAMLTGVERSLSPSFAALQEHGFSIVYAGKLADYEEATLAQNCRQHASCLLGMEDEDWLMPSEADLWPLRREFYQVHLVDNVRHRAVCYYWNGDHFHSKQVFLGAVAERRRHQTIPTCHVAMRAADWRAIYGLTPGESIAAATQRTLDEWFTRYPRDGFNTWMSDQDIMTERLCRQEWFPDWAPVSNRSVLFVPRPGHPPVDRLDRSHVNDWLAPFDASRWTDAHVHKAPESDEHWPLLLKVIDAVIPQHVEWARAYRERYVEASR